MVTNDLFRNTYPGDVENSGGKVKRSVACSNCRTARKKVSISPTPNPFRVVSVLERQGVTAVAANLTGSV